jgi:hypothetical protein
MTHVYLMIPDDQNTLMSNRILKIKTNDDNNDYVNTNNITIPILEIMMTHVYLMIPDDFINHLGLKSKADEVKTVFDLFSYF